MTALGVAEILLLAATLAAPLRGQESAPVSGAERTRRQLLQRWLPDGPESARAACVRGRMEPGSVPVRVFLSHPDSLRLENLSTGEHVLLHGADAFVVHPGRQAATATAIQREMARRLLAMLSTALLWPLTDAGDVAVDDAGRLRLGREAEIWTLAVGTDGEMADWQVPSGASVRMEGWRQRGGIVFPDRIRWSPGDNDKPVTFVTETIAGGWSFDVSLFDPRPGEGSRLRTSQLGQPPDLRRFRPQVIDVPAATLFITDDPVDWPRRLALLAPIGRELAEPGQGDPEPPCYFVEEGRARLAIPLRAMPGRLPKALGAAPWWTRTRPAERVLVLDVRGHPAHAGAALPALLRHCRQHGLEPVSGARFVPSLVPGDAMPQSLDVLTTRIELPVRSR